MTNDILCGYTGDREAMLMSYLYDDVASADRQAFEQHLTTCARCRSELNGLDDVRSQLARWAPPEPNFTVLRRQLSAIATVAGAPEVGDSRRGWWREVPAWAQVVAALLVLGVAAGIANFDIRYDHNGLSIHTGWSRSAGNAVAPDSASRAATDDRAAWRAELTAVEQQLRSEMHTAPASAPAGGLQVAHVSSSDADVMRRVKVLLDESERRQQNELALRMGEVIRDLNVQRQADLRKIDQNLGVLQDRTGVEVLRNRQKLDYILQRVSQQPQ